MTQKIQEMATIIANAFLATQPEKRAVMLAHVAVVLSRANAPYTASVFKQLAVKYETEQDILDNSPKRLP